MEKPPYPILEFDPTRRAVIEPSAIIKRQPDLPPHVVLCFFQDVIAKLVEEGQAEKIGAMRSEMGRHPIYRAEWDGRSFTLMHPGVGAPLAVGLMEEVIARGGRAFVACGGAGVLNSDLAVGHLVIPTGAIRDEGTSYHYQPPAREIAADREVIAALEAVLQRYAVPYVLGKTWTTDAFFRETPVKVARRRDEGCVTVEMETAAFIAAARFREAPFGQLLYGGDDVSGETWDARDWVAHTDVREAMVWLAAEACLSLDV